MTKQLLASLAACLLPLTTFAQGSYPDKPIRLIVPFAPGGVTDTSGRVIADALSKRLGQQVFVDNRAGASGNIDTQLVAAAPPDGYALGGVEQLAKLGIAPTPGTPEAFAAQLRTDLANYGKVVATAGIKAE